MSDDFNLRLLLERTYVLKGELYDGTSNCIIVWLRVHLGWLDMDSGSENLVLLFLPLTVFYHVVYACKLVDDSFFDSLELGRSIGFCV